MKKSNRLFRPLGGTLAAAIAAIATIAAAADIQTTGHDGDPNSTTTIDGKQLPPPDPAFGGTVLENAYPPKIVTKIATKIDGKTDGKVPVPIPASKPYWPPRVVPRQGAPNVLLIMLDDVGFGAHSTFGGVIPTPALDRIASAGLRYTQFHSTALCSPSRAALITGRNHHSVGNGVVSELSSGYDGYDSIIPKNAATIGTILKNNGYSTSWFGKNHNTPQSAKSQAGPFDQWPVGMGFEYFYGFVCGDTNQWQPNLFRNTTAVDPSTDPRMAEPGWNLTTAMADDAIGWLNQLNQLSPDKPFLCYYVPGGTHAPHHATPEWIEKISAMHLFDEGWNKLRERIFANQKRLGVIPRDAKLTPWPSVREWGKNLPVEATLPEWDTVGEDAKKLYIRQAEVYAAYLAYTDHEVGRVIQAVEDLGKLDNTLIIYISGDNGSSAEGGLDGTPNELTYFNGKHVSVEEQMHTIPTLGSDKHYNHMACGWAWAFNTPFKWTKQVASHFGGTQQGVCISWPGHITDVGGIRNQFHHIIDIAPTILEAAQIPAPAVVNGIQQKPIEGVSMAYTFPKHGADKPSTHQTQYFEMEGVHGIYNNGWYACTTPVKAPWAFLGRTEQDPAHGYKWELYDITRDWTQHDDVASANPTRLKSMQDLFMSEARKYQVLPLNADPAALLHSTRPSLAAGRTEFVYTKPLTGIPLNGGPKLINTSYSIKADIEVPADGGEGVILTQGGRFTGWALYLKGGHPVFTWNVYGLDYFHWRAKTKLSPGKHSINFDFTYDGDSEHYGKSGTGVLAVDGVVIATEKMKHTVMTCLPDDESFDIGSDTGTPVCDKDYAVPFPFTGTIEKITISLPPAPPIQPSPTKLTTVAATEPVKKTTVRRTPANPARASSTPPATPERGNRLGGLFSGGKGQPAGTSGSPKRAPAFQKTPGR